MAEVGNLTATLSLDASGFEKGIDQATKQTNMFADVLGANLATKAIGLAVDGLKKLGDVAADTFKEAVKGFADYEQLVGGSKLVFGDAYDYIIQKSEEAYKSVNMSQNEYLQQVNGFAVGLTTALDGNQQAAAELADKIVTAEADVVAALGVTQEAAQNAFNGIMKGNFMMVDNLGLGIKATKEGFQEMIDKVNEWNIAHGTATNYTMDNLADMQAALVDYIDMQGLAGYSAQEASSTVSGSISQMKAAWKNLVAGLGNDKADLDKLVDDFFKSANTAWEKLEPVAERVLENMIDVAIEALPKFVDLGLKIGEAILKGLAKLLLKPLAWLADKVSIGITGYDLGGNLRAFGGPVEAGVPYVTGELGPELFVPKTDGYILNNEDTESLASGLGGINITIQGDVYDDELSMRQKISNAVRGVLETELAYG